MGSVHSQLASYHAAWTKRGHPTVTLAHASRQTNQMVRLKKTQSSIKSVQSWVSLAPEPLFFSLKNSWPVLQGPTPITKRLFTNDPGNTNGCRTNQQQPPKLHFALSYFHKRTSSVISFISTFVPVLAMSYRTVFPFTFPRFLCSGAKMGSWRTHLLCKLFIDGQVSASELGVFFWEQIHLCRTRESSISTYSTTDTTNTFCRI